MTEEINEQDAGQTTIREILQRKLQAIAPTVHEVFPGAFFNVMVHQPIPGADGNVALMTANISNMQPQQLTDLLSEFLKKQPGYGDGDDASTDANANAHGIGPDTDPDTAPAVQETAANDAAAETEKADDATAANEAAIAAESEKKEGE
jgi:hypothetical protein